MPSAGAPRCCRSSASRSRPRSARTSTKTFLRDEPSVAGFDSAAGALGWHGARRCRLRRCNHLRPRSAETRARAGARVRQLDATLAHCNEEIEGLLTALERPLPARKLWRRSGAQSRQPADRAQPLRLRSRAACPRARGLGYRCGCAWTPGSPPTPVPRRQGAPEDRRVHALGRRGLAPPGRAREPGLPRWARPPLGRGGAHERASRCLPAAALEAAAHRCAGQRDGLVPRPVPARDALVRRGGAAGGARLREPAGANAVARAQRRRWRGGCGPRARLEAEATRWSTARVCSRTSRAATAPGSRRPRSRASSGARSVAAAATRRWRVCSSTAWAMPTARASTAPRGPARFAGNPRRSMRH